MKILKFGIGLDIGKDKFDACISSIDETQRVKIKAQRCFDNKFSGFKVFYGWVLKNTKDTTTSYLMEATGVYYEQLAWFIHKNQGSVSVILPNKARKYKEALGLKSKNDRIDAKGLARMCCEQNHTLWSPINDNTYEMRMITRKIQSLSEMNTSLKNQLHAMQYGMHRVKGIEKMIEKQIQSFEKNKQTLESQIEDIVANDPTLKKKFEQICKITGLGYQSLAVIVAETNGFAAFESTSQLINYAGYDIVENQSGNRKGKTRISKKGNSHIRRSLFFPAFTVVTYRVAPFKDLYDRVFERTKIKMKAYVAVQKKLLTIIYALWKKDEAFDPEYQTERQDNTSGDNESEPSFASIPEESVTDEAVIEDSLCNSEKINKIIPAKTGITQDRHPSKNRRLPSFA